MQLLLATMTIMIQIFETAKQIVNIQQAQSSINGLQICIKTLSIINNQQVPKTGLYTFSNAYIGTNFVEIGQC